VGLAAFHPASPLPRRHHTACRLTDPRTGLSTASPASVTIVNCVTTVTNALAILATLAILVPVLAKHAPSTWLSCSAWLSCLAPWHLGALTPVLASGAPRSWRLAPPDYLARPSCSPGSASRRHAPTAHPPLVPHSSLAAAQHRRAHATQAIPLASLSRQAPPTIECPHCHICHKCHECIGLLGLLGPLDAGAGQTRPSPLAFLLPVGLHPWPPCSSRPSSGQHEAPMPPLLLPRRPPWPSSSPRRPPLILAYLLP
jgi:hypothetical protein